MQSFNVPTGEQVSPANQAIFESLKSKYNVVPNLYATFAHSDTALETYVALQGAKSSLDGKQREVVNLVVSQVNSCQYCLAAHTLGGKMNGFSEAQIMEMRHGRASFDPKLDALAIFTKAVTEKRGQVDPATLQAFFDGGWTKGNVVDVIVAIGDKIITNYLHAVTKIPVDLPAAAPLAA